MGIADQLELGTSNAICDICGFKFKHNTLRKDWRGLMLCWQCYETRSPQEFLRGIPDNPGIEDPRPDSPAAFMGVSEVNTPPVPASGDGVKNGNVFTVCVSISGGVDVSVSISGWPALEEGGAYQLAPGDVITLVYTTIPQWEWSVQ